MSWMEQLVETYDENERFAGRGGIDGMKALLPPVGHIVQNVQIEMTLSANGELIRAEAIAKEQQPTLIPCTPDSASRTSSPSPHPLHDNLSYISRDYYEFAKKPPKGETIPYLLYKEQLGAWAALGNPKVQAVYRYISSHDVIHDLIAKKVLFQDAAGKLLEKWTDKDATRPLIFSVVAGDLLKAMVRFRVIVDGDDCPELWNDTHLQKDYQTFFQQEFLQEETQICYATGKKLPPTDKHGKGIRFPGDGAKIISSNDMSGFTFRGRFVNGDECTSIGYETSQKAMNALMWLARNQGYAHDGRVFLAWGRCGQTPPPVFDDTARLTRRRRPAGAECPSSLKGWAESLTKTLAGYQHEFKQAEMSQVNVMILDAATKGRLSICYYSEMAGEDFIERIERWHSLGRWRQHGYDSEKDEPFVYFGVPAPKRIVEACHGVSVGDSQMKLELERIFYAILQGNPLPLDMERMLIGRSVKRAICDDYYGWRRQILEPACSVVARRLNHKKEEYTVALDETKADRSYLFGRLIAVADQMERATFSRDEMGSRTTNAMRYMEIFFARPASTWMTLQKKLLPYQQKREMYGGKERKLISKIGSMFHDDDFLSDRPLDGKFLLGYYCQQYAMELEREENRKKKEALQEEEA